MKWTNKTKLWFFIKSNEPMMKQKIKTFGERNHKINT